MVASSAMNNVRLAGLLEQRLPNLKGHPGRWRAEVDGLLVFVMTDEGHDRMRVMIPIGEVDPGDVPLMQTLLGANFDRALDAKYALNDDVLWSTFLHRLSWLTEAELDNAIEQVMTLARNTGTTFASSDLVFGSDEDDLEE